jgi:hypothetical protein
VREIDARSVERRRDLIVKLAKEIPGLEVNVPEEPSICSPNAADSSENRSVTER